MVEWYCFKGVDGLNHEEKILELLTTIQKDVSGIGRELTSLKQDVTDLKQDVDGLKQDVTTLRKDVTVLQEDVTTLKKETQFIRGIAVKIENDHGKKLDALFDGCSSIFDIMIRYHPRISSLESKMDQLVFEVRYLKAAS